MIYNIQHYSELLYLPEFSLSISIFLILIFFIILEYFYNIDNLNKWCGYISILFLLQILYFLDTFSIINIQGTFLYFQYEFNNFLVLLKIIVIIINIFCIFFAINYSFNEKIIHWEYYILVLFSCLGNMLLISSFDLISIYFSIEIQSLCFYILASFKIHSNFSTEASIKYFTQGAVASGIFLLGSSIIYFATGTTNIYSTYLILNSLLVDYKFSFISEYIFTYQFNIDFLNIFIFGISLIIISLFMKLAIVPFHMWAPDVYEGVPTSITFIFALLPKIGLIINIIHINILCIESLAYFPNFLTFICSICSIIIGIFASLYQIKIKRWLAFAGIVHMGYIIMIITIPNIISLKILLFYLFIYIIISISIFIIILIIRKQTNNNKIKFINELLIISNNNKYLAIYFSLILLSIIGIPPLIGFFSKYFLFYLFINEHLYSLSILLICLNVISGFYYLRLIKKMFFIKKNNNIRGFLNKLSHIDSLCFSIFLFINIFSCLYIEEMLSII